jgi:photosystem II stability/assembly factor-like uncharacterized protein
MRSIALGFACLLLSCGSNGGTDQNSPDPGGTTSGARGTAMGSAGGAMPNGSAGNPSATGGSAGNANPMSGNADASATGGSLNTGDAMATGALGREGGASASGCGTSARKNNAEGRPRACVSSGVCDTPHKSTFAPVGKAPDLKLGVVTDLGPPFGPITDGGNALAMTLDPNNTAIIYVGVEAKNGGSPNNGLWRSKDGGSTWKLLGSGSDKDPYDCQTSYLDLPINIRVDPQDSNHLYVTEGVRGAGNGFWVSWDAGETWTRAYSEDLTAISVDPCDFCHVIVGSHGFEPVGVLESTDGGYSWILHPPPAGAGWGGGSYGVNMLYDPASGQGDPKTWLVHNGAMWRTKDAGTTWSKVSDLGGIHGFTTIYYAKTGALYSGAGTAPARSLDNGLTWQATSKGLPNAIYYGVSGDGTNVFVMPDGNPAPGPLMSTPESDGMNWTAFGDMKKIERGMQHPRFDPNSGILYFVNNMTLHAVRVTDPR